MIRRSAQACLLLAAITLVALGASPTAAPAQDDGSLDRAVETGMDRVAEQPLVLRSELESQLQRLQDRVRTTDERRWIYLTLTGSNSRFRERIENLEKPVQLRVSGAEFSQDTLTIRPATVEEVRELIGRMETIRKRLREGDFRQGDRVMLSVPADTTLTGTFSVNRFRQLELPGSFGNVDLSGVLYSEIDSVAREAVSEYVRNPRVRTRVLWPVAITGGVSAPGYYNLPPGTTLSEALMEAGGPTSGAKLKKIAYRRGNRDLLKSRKEGSEQIPVEMITLADLNAKAGDELHVPAGGGGRGTALQVLGVVSGLSGTIFAITRIF